MNNVAQRRRALRLATWLTSISVGVRGGALALATVAPAGAVGARAFLAWCGIG